MPLLHQDSSRGSGGSHENRRSIAELLGLDTRLPDPAASGQPQTNDCGSENDWPWESPSSPEVAQTPRALVPANCFPPRHPRAYTSFSESAQPGAMWSDEPPAVWSDEPPGQGITDLVASLKALAMPASGPGTAMSAPPPSYDRNEIGTELQWSSEQTTSLQRDNNRAKLLARRASFCGTVSGGEAGLPLSWSGSLPARNTDITAEFSPKLFLGGIPWDISEDALMYALRHFNPVCVEWPGPEGAPRGFAYVTLESCRRVRALLAACRRRNNSWFYRLHSRKRQPKEVEVIPWAVCEANWVSCGSARLAAARSVFVGALHGMLTAHALATIMNDLFSGVVYAGIDTDKNKYPIGSGRVTFDNVHSYVRAISAAYIEINTDKFSKKVQINPYLEDSMCSSCNLQQGPYFCREPTCFGYYCRSCWLSRHPREEHKPLMRNSKSSAPAADCRPPANGHQPRHSPEYANMYNGLFAGQSEGTPSPSTSGTSASDADAETGAEADAGWMH